jgi:hypothetical protein
MLINMELQISIIILSQKLVLFELLFAYKITTNSPMGFHEVNFDEEL